jgi:succinate dehydrogenase hydrophobic anchor subunit
MTAPLWLLSGIALLGAIGFAIPDDYITRDPVRVVINRVLVIALASVSVVLALIAWSV